MSLNPLHVLIVLVLGVLFFGKNLPEVARQLGSSLMEFRKGLDEWKETRHRSPNVKASTAAVDEESAERFEALGTKFEPPV